MSYTSNGIPNLSCNCILFDSNSELKSDGLYELIYYPNCQTKPNKYMIPGDAKQIVHDNFIIELFYYLHPKSGGIFENGGLPNSSTACYIAITPYIEINLKIDREVLTKKYINYIK